MSAIESSSFVQAVQYVVAEGVKCCRLLCALESSSFEQGESTQMEQISPCYYYFPIQYMKTDTCTCTYTVANHFILLPKKDVCIHAGVQNWEH